MLYLKLSRNQEQEWSSVTVSSLAKKLVGVNNIVIENVELEATSVGKQVVILERPRKNAQNQLSCGRDAMGQQEIHEHEASGGDGAGAAGWVSSSQATKRQGQDERRTAALDSLRPAR